MCIDVDNDNAEEDPVNDRCVVTCFLKFVC